MKILAVEGLERSYQNTRKDIEVLKGLNFSIEEHEFIGIMGKSGCGKTTLLKILGLIDKSTKGNVFFKERNIEQLWDDELAEIRRNEIGFIFQDFYLMDCLSVLENIMLPMILNYEETGVMLKKVKEYAEHFEIDKLLEKAPYELSGGEKQRVAICRALINNPDLLLADEPTGNLDSKSSKIVIDTLERVNQVMGKTIIMVTHDPWIASYCSRVIFLKDGEIMDTSIKKGTREQFLKEIMEKMVQI